MRMNSTPLKTLGPQAANLVTTLHERSRAVFHLEDGADLLGVECLQIRRLDLSEENILEFSRS